MNDKKQQKRACTVLSNIIDQQLDFLETFKLVDEDNLLVAINKDYKTAKDMWVSLPEFVRDVNKLNTETTEPEVEIQKPISPESEAD